MSMRLLYQKDKHYSRTIFTFLIIYLLDKNDDHRHMLTSDIRRKNARMLSDAAGSPAEFGRRTGMSDSQISQLIGENPTKNIGNIIARRIEAAFSKEKGWMDVLQEDKAGASQISGGHSRSNVDEPLSIVAPIPENYVDAADFVKLADLYRRSTRDGRLQILETAEIVEKIVINRKGKSATD